MHFGFMDVMLLHSGHTYISAIYRVVRISSEQFAVWTISSLNDLDHNSSRVFCVHHWTCSKLQIFTSDILYSLLFYLIIQP